ncbi:penicillin-binding protein 1A [Bryocella elongata]|uniref:Penicillin-binding protein 1A n=1 Tax=Bryocella elongata TaxID=863522 RepID=A0A1H6B7J1_9BACT|nr:PBP1A family penicillin-binding protein [Bryocella elongata]SEG56590.1 penicillin-binding protein 1A [Bryocella elongata]
MLNLNGPESEKPGKGGVAAAGEPEPESKPLRPELDFWRAVRRFPFFEADFRNRPLAARAGFALLMAASAVFGVMVGLVLVYSINLPQMAELEHYRPSTTTELYDVHGEVIGSFALERRVVEPYSEFPQVLQDAIISIEDKNFFTNSGLNLVRMAEAAYEDVHSHGKVQGASTLTMQLARNLFLSSEKTYGRKIQEIFLTLQIERRFTKDQIFTLYANQIYLGRGTYGFEAASEYYFSKHVHDLTLPEAALLAALPKGAEYYNPIRHPERAMTRRNLVLSEMVQDHKITREQAAVAEAAPLGLHIEPPANTEAPYFVEEVRRQLERDYGVEEAHGAGLRVYTTMDLELQRTAKKALLDGLASYERRHGWKAKIDNVSAAYPDLNNYKHPDWVEPVKVGSYFHVLVTAVAPTKLTVRLGQQEATLTPPDWAWTQKFKATDLFKPGDIAYVRVTAAPAGAAPSVVLEQDSGAQGSLMAVDNSNGEVLAMVGGRDADLSQFNRATQAQRQVGSSFKIYDYVAALEAGMKPYDSVSDVPTTFYTPNGPYTPHDYERGSFAGSMSLIDAFAESRNIPALRLADKVGIKNVIAVAHRFGVTSNIPNFLPVAIGAADITLAEQVASYSVFPNDGIRIQPHYIRRVSMPDGSPVEQKTPEVKEVLSLETARQMMILLQAVTAHGTAAATASMKHALGGKTGTTNNYTDAWFLGFSPSITAGVWVGYDSRVSLGEKETGARAALPIWMDFMKVAIADRPNEQFSKAGAPKKQIQVPTTDEGEALPKAKTADDSDDTGDSDSTAPADSKPATPSPSAPAPPPANDALPNDEPSKPSSAAPIVRQAAPVARPATPGAAPIVRQTPPATTATPRTTAQPPR